MTAGDDSSGAARPSQAKVDSRPPLKPSPRPDFLGVPPLRFQEQYVWLVFLGGMDVMFTWFILERRGGREVNPVAKEVIDAWGLWGSIAFKFSLIVFVIVACEWIARDKPRTAIRLIWFALIVSVLPVIYSAALLIFHWMSPPAL